MDEFLFRIIDTEQFQRLRHIKQLGAVHYVFPSANHTRFEHSIGYSISLFLLFFYFNIILSICRICYLAGKLIERLKNEQADFDINENDVSCIKIAALCSQLNTGPLSETLDFHLEKTQESKKSKTLKSVVKGKKSDIFNKIFDDCLNGKEGYQFLINTDYKKLIENLLDFQNKKVY